MLKYKILVADGSSALADQVNAAIAEGWEPQGSISVASTFSPAAPSEPAGIEYLFAQAMVLREDTSLEIEDPLPEDLRKKQRRFPNTITNEVRCMVRS